MGVTRVLLAEDHTLVRCGIRLLVAEIPEIQVIGEAGNGREAIVLTRELHPDVILMDITMPELNGLEATSQIKKEFPRVQIIILSVHSSEEYAVQALKRGASGYLLKEAGPDELSLAIRSVFRGVSYLSPAISKQVIADYLRRLDGDRNTFDQLTSRQHEVLQLIAEGCTTKEIAVKLKLSEKTVQSHRSQLMHKLGAHDVAALVRFAVRNGIVSTD